jgi:DNA-binding response OmpR family regulator
MPKAPKIMVVDDELKICKNVEKILSKSNYDVTHAVSAQEALAKMTKEAYSLLISDIIMPEVNGLELLKMVKKEWPLTKTVMMTAYASTDTAVKAIRLGALDYISKPFTPDELRNTVETALQNKLVEAKISDKERDAIDVIAVDVPFDRDEVAQSTGEAYADMFGRSDMPIVEVKAHEPLEHFCEFGEMVCDVFKKLGATCQAGVKTNACPQRKAKKRKGQKRADAFDSQTLIGIDQPFSYQEVVSVTGPEYIHTLQSEGLSLPYYEQLKENVSRLMGKPETALAADIPQKEARADHLVDERATPDVEVTVSAPLENFCALGDMVCDIFRKLGATCKAGIKSSTCPQIKRKRKAAASKGLDSRKYIAPEQPFEYDEVIAVTGSDYVEHIYHDDVVMVPYAEVKARVAAMEAELDRQAAGAAQMRMEASTDNSVLIIDDEVAVNNNIRKILAKKGYQVEQAVTKAEALEKIASTSYALVLLDLKMPGVKGLELLKAVTESNPATKVIMITGYASIETAVEAARIGAVDYLPKPFTPDEIRHAADAALALAA